MFAAEHRRPFAAFLLVCAAGFLITGFGLRTQVVQVLVDNGAPAALVGVVAPDVILGETLSSKPAPPAEAAPSASAQSPDGPDVPDVRDEPAASAPTTITLDPPAAAHRAAKPAVPHHRRAKAAGTHAQSSATVAAVSTPVRPSTATPAPAPAAIPAPAPGKPSAGKPTPVRAELQAPTTRRRAWSPTVQAPTLAAASAGRGHGHGERSWSRRRARPRGPRHQGCSGPAHLGTDDAAPRLGAPPWRIPGSLTPRPSRADRATTRATVERGHSRHGHEGRSGRH